MNHFTTSYFSLQLETDGKISEEDFRYFQSLLLNLAGISLSEKKRDLLKSRLGPYLIKNNFQDYSTYRKFLETLPTEHAEWQNLINLMTTNKTDFFRESAHFDYIEERLIPEWIKLGKKEVHVWSAASSSGEEAYTLAMFLKAKLPIGMNFKILASDIDTNILKKAQNGVYSITKLNEIPEVYRKDSIDYGRESIENWFRIKRHLKGHITFQQHNLIEDSLPSDQLFDLILCRNVMIYFPKDIVIKVANKLLKASLPDGTLFIGHSESLQGNQTPWFLSAPSVYKKTKSYQKKLIASNLFYRPSRIDQEMLYTLSNKK